ncbi:MAG: E2/UBC family protein [Bacteroidota bacterium]
MRRQFQLPEEDILFLDSLTLIWETISDKGMHWVIIFDYPICPGYNVAKVAVAIKIGTGYPRARLDMSYFFPALQRTDGKRINALAVQPIDGKQFQRWSRHRTVLNPWREGIDDLSTHMGLISFWLEYEFTKQPNGITT